MNMHWVLTPEKGLFCLETGTNIFVGGSREKGDRTLTLEIGESGRRHNLCYYDSRCESIRDTEEQNEALGKEQIDTLAKWLDAKELKGDC